jgi:hypothetical protein
MHGEIELEEGGRGRGRGGEERCGDVAVARTYVVVLIKSFWLCGAMRSL